MAACEDGFVTVDALADKALTDAVWQYVQGPNIPETQWGTTVDQEQYVIQFIAQKYGKQVAKIKPATTIEDLTDETFDHLVIAEQNLMGYNEHHWLLRRKGADWVTGGFIHVDDSALSLDYENDQWSVSQVWEAVQWLQGQYGWLFSWN